MKTSALAILIVLIDIPNTVFYSIFSFLFKQIVLTKFSIL